MQPALQINADAICSCAGRQERPGEPLASSQVAGHPSRQSLKGPDVPPGTQRQGLPRTDAGVCETPTATAIMLDGEGLESPSRPPKIQGQVEGAALATATHSCPGGRVCSLGPNWKPPGSLTSEWTARGHPHQVAAARVQRSEAALGAETGLELRAHGARERPMKSIHCDRPSL